MTVSRSGRCFRPSDADLLAAAEAAWEADRLEVWSEPAGPPFTTRFTTCVRWRIPGVIQGQVWKDRSEHDGPLREALAERDRWAARVRVLEERLRRIEAIARGDALRRNALGEQGG